MRSSDSSQEFHELGVPGDTAVPSAYLKQVGGQVTGDALAAARLSPKNVTGTGNVRNRIGALGEDPRDGVMHLFPNATGTPASGTPGFIGNLYVPTGFSSIRGKADDKYLRGEDGKNVLDTVYSNIQVRYRAGALRKFGYSGPLVISFVHAGPIHTADREPTPIANGEVRPNGTQLVGTIGADGSPYDGGGGGGRSLIQYYGSKRRRDTEETPYRPRTYVHNHVIFYRYFGKRKVTFDPRSVFCSDLGFR